MAGETLDLSQPRRVHIVGIGGAGMSAIAAVLSAMGHRVSGSDLKDSAVLADLRSLGIDVEVGHEAGHVGDVEFVAISTAVPEHNPEVVAARDRAIPVVRRAPLLAAICRTRRCIAVSGTHGKTTTSAMVVSVLAAGGLEPSFLVGGAIHEWGGGAAWRDGEWLVVEADESDGTFVELDAERVVVTSVEADHLDYFGTPDAIEAAFDRFLDQARGPNLVYADDPVALELAQRHGARTYGTAAVSDYRLDDIVSEGAGVRFRLFAADEELGVVQLPVPGRYNAYNAAAAISCAIDLGVPFDVARDALGRYAGVARRFEVRGTAGGVTFVDDYAHNPGKVAAVLAAARAGAWRRVVAVFQPHLYTRTAALWPEFGEAFADADLVVVTDVYGAREDPAPGVTGKLIVDGVLDAHPWKRVAYLPRRSDVVSYLQRELRPDDLCLTLGAGDITSLPDELLVVVA